MAASHIIPFRYISKISSFNTNSDPSEAYSKCFLKAEAHTFEVDGTNPTECNVMVQDCTIHNWQLTCLNFIL